MDEAEKVLEQVDSMHLEFAKRAAVSKFETFFVKLKQSDKVHLKWTNFHGKRKCFTHFELMRGRKTS